jgi:hypothetical protein
MRIMRTGFRSWLGIAIILLGGTTILPVRIYAQAAGQNAVFNSSTTTNTSAFIDAANFSSSGDICAKLHAILVSSILYIQATNWQVIDARGIVPTSGSTQPCTSNPWATLGSGRDWVTILLPAGTIQIATTWTLPQYTKIIGEGPGTTILQACTSISCTAGAFSPGSAMIQMGCGNGSCGQSFGVGVENLTLDGQSQVIDGIDNSDAEEQSYAKHVQMINIGGTGLSLGIDTSTSKTNHSSYSDISITETSVGNACINIQPNAQPRGIHGITCTCLTSSGSVCSSSNSHPGIYLDGSDVSLQDVNINGFGDGIRIGSQGTSGTVQNNIIFNITGGTNVNDLVHICGSNYGSHSACSQTSNAVSDLTVMGITSSANNTIQDDVADTLLAESTDPTVGMYIVGEQVTLVSGSLTGYSRFTTSPSIPTWRVGTADPPIGSCSIGTLYSRTSNSSTSPPTVWGCTGSSSWTPIK